MMLLKVCPRCRGDMFTNRDRYGEYRQCIQCGCMIDVVRPKEPPSSRISPAVEEEAWEIQAASARPLP